MNEHDEALVDEAARMLLSVRTHADPIDDLPDRLRPKTLDESYFMQDRLNGMLAQTGYGTPVGYKIGCTTAVMQDYLGIPHPCAGKMFDGDVFHDSGTFSRSSLCRPGVECEIAVRIDRDMVADQPFSIESCDSFVRAAMASIELVDDRWTDFRTVSTPALVAENFFNAGCVLGQPSAADGGALKETAGTMWINGERAGSASGSEILGHPYAALAWLANHQMKRDTPLKAGDYVTLGSVVQTQWIDAGDTIEIEFTGLGKCILRLEP